MKRSYKITHKAIALTAAEREREKLSASREVYRELVKYISQKRQSA